MIGTPLKLQQLNNFGEFSPYFFGYKMYNKKYYIRAKQQLKDLKINGCAICGYNRCNRALNFHHTNPQDKKFQVNIRNVRKKKVKDLVNEINKCILLCCNCHMEIEDINNDNKIIKENMECF